MKKDYYITIDGEKQWRIDDSLPVQRDGLLFFLDMSVFKDRQEEEQAVNENLIDRVYEPHKKYNPLDTE